MQTAARVAIIRLGMICSLSPRSAVPRGGIVDQHPRLLLIGPPPPGFDPGPLAAEVEPVAADPAEVARRLHDDRYAAVFATPGVVADLLDQFRRDELIIRHIDKGLAVLDPAGTVTWANGV